MLTAYAAQGQKGGQAPRERTPVGCAYRDAKRLGVRTSDVTPILWSSPYGSWVLILLCVH